MRRRTSFRSGLYTLARFLGDLNAISRGPKAIEKRVERRILGRAASRIINALVGR
jgi:hypothetical protein